MSAEIVACLLWTFLCGLIAMGLALLCGSDNRAVLGAVCVGVGGGLLWAIWCLGGSGEADEKVQEEERS